MQCRLAHLSPVALSARADSYSSSDRVSCRFLSTRQRDHQTHAHSTMTAGSKAYQDDTLREGPYDRLLNLPLNRPQWPSERFGPGRFRCPLKRTGSILVRHHFANNYCSERTNHALAGHCRNWSSWPVASPRTPELVVHGDPWLPVSKGHARIQKKVPGSRDTLQTVLLPYHFDHSHNAISSAATSIRDWPGIPAGL